MSNIKGSFDLMKKLNVSLILQTIREDGPISRAQIAEDTDLTAATISKITRELIEVDLIKEGTIGKSSGGRPPIMLELNAKAGYLIGINLGPGLLEVILTNLDGEIINKQSKEIEIIEQEIVLNKVKKMIRDVIKASKIDNDKLMGIGIALHGMVDSDKGESIFAPFYGWHYVQIREFFAKEFSVPVFIENDVRAMALGEKWFGVAEDVDDFLILYVGNGIGSGIMIDGNLYRGVNYSAGEIGHVIIDNDGPQCSCGKFGCLESLASDIASVNRMNKLLEMKGHNKMEDLTMEQICELANQGDDLALQVLEEKINYLGTGISNLLNILDPKMVVICGAINNASALLFSYLKKIINKQALNTSAVNLKLKTTSLGENSATIGAITLVLNEFFKAGGKL